MSHALSQGSGSFKIDDPLDPANKDLSRSFVQKHGLPTVVLPEYFDVLTRDFRYQLTVMGPFAQGIVAKGIPNNRCVIRTR